MSAKGQSCSPAQGPEGKRTHRAVLLFLLPSMVTCPGAEVCSRGSLLLEGWRTVSEAITARGGTVWALLLFLTC